MKKIIVITSGKGGVGKTTTAINLGAAINHFGQDVLVIDANLTTPNVGVHLNSPEVPVNLNHVLTRKAEPYEAVYEHDSGMKIMPSSLSVRELRKIKPERISDFRNEFKKISDYIIVDSSAGLGNEATSVMKMADQLIVVTNPEIAAITDALKTIKLAEQMGIPVLGTIVTRVNRDDIEMQPETVKDMLEVPILGMVPEHPDVKRSLNLRDAVVNAYPQSDPARAYKEIAAKIIGIEYDSRADRENFFKRIFNKIRGR
ncbi:MAG TPA: cell division ATPase MinD [Candidatus Omnitrophota bacterium]|nr:cell division ATPase MinD [Candidatus Omnitrophota bacterium]